MSFEGLTPVTDVRAGAWIAPRLCGFGGRVCCVVPGGFASYTRILHPAADEHDLPASWAQVCERTGRIAHPLMQWHMISTAPPGAPRTEASCWPGSDPQPGILAPAVLAQILEILSGHTPGPGDCYHAVWDGWGWLPPAVPAPLLSPGPVPLSPPTRPGQMLAGPRLNHPHRDYLLFHGPLQAALGIGHDVTADWRLPQSPNLLWPADRSWLLATEIDFDSTLIGGSTQLAEELLQAPHLETWPIGIEDDLSINGDRINYAADRPL